jgi:hypothetical protein
MSKLIVHLELDLHDCPLLFGWKLYSFNPKHSHFKHPKELGLGPLDEFGDPRVEKPSLARKLKRGTAFILSYYEHGTSMWFLRGDYVPGVEFQWDGVRVAVSSVLKWGHFCAVTRDSRSLVGEHFFAANSLSHR